VLRNDTAAGTGSLQARLESGGPGMSALLAYSALAGGQCLCALALVGDASNWDDETRSLLHVVAAAVTAQIRHAKRRVRVPMLRADGTERMVELTAAQLSNDGETFFCGFFRDLTELEHSQAALAETEARFRLLTQLAPVGIVQSDAGDRALGSLATFTDISDANGQKPNGNGYWPRNRPPVSASLIRPNASTA
jgi:PAS domain-containing protein